MGASFRRVIEILGSNDSERDDERRENVERLMERLYGDVSKIHGYQFQAASEGFKELSKRILDDCLREHDVTV